MANNGTAMCASLGYVRRKPELGFWTPLGFGAKTGCESRMCVGKCLLVVRLNHQPAMWSRSFTAWWHQWAPLWEREFAWFVHCQAFPLDRWECLLQLSCLFASSPIVVWCATLDRRFVFECRCCKRFKANPLVGAPAFCFYPSVDCCVTILDPTLKPSEAVWNFCLLCGFVLMLSWVKGIIMRALWKQPCKRHCCFPRLGKVLCVLRFGVPFFIKGGAEIKTYAIASFFGVSSMPFRTEEVQLRGRERRH